MLYENFFELNYLLRQRNVRISTLISEQKQNLSHFLI